MKNGKAENGMSYFPMFVDLEKKQILAVGAGTVGFRRISVLLSFGACITVVDPESVFLENLVKPGEETFLQGGSICWLKGTYEEYRDTVLSRQPYFMVLASTGCPDTDNQAAADGRRAGAFVSMASDRTQSDFYFPGIAAAGPVTAGITAGGEHHRLARIASQEVRELFERKAEEWKKAAGEDKRRDSQ